MAYHNTTYNFQDFANHVLNSCAICLILTYKRAKSLTTCVFRAVEGWCSQGIEHHTRIDLEHTSEIADTSRHIEGDAINQSINQSNNQSIKICGVCRT